MNFNYEMPLAEEDVQRMCLWEHADEMMYKIHKIYGDLQPLTTSKVVVKIAKPLSKELPKEDDEFIELCDILIQTEEWIMLQMVTSWIKIRGTVYDMKYFDTYQNWLERYIDGWGGCDIFCYRVLNPMVEKFPELFTVVQDWAVSDRVYTRRASAVCFINSAGSSFSVHVPFEWVNTICNIHKRDEHPHIQKGIGWLLKYSFLSYPEATEKYLKENLSLLSRTTFRYALEKIEPGKREELMKLKV